MDTILDEEINSNPLVIIQRDMQSVTHTRMLLRFVSEVSVNRTSCFDYAY